jgi:hypothetical protein
MVSVQLTGTTERAPIEQRTFERGDDAEVATTSTQPPQEIRMRLLIDLQEVAISGHYFN